MVLLRQRGYTTIKFYANINGKDRGGDNSKGNNEGGKGDGGRGYEDGGDYGDDDGGNGGDDDTKWRQRQRGWHLPPSTKQGHYSQEQEYRKTRPAADQLRWPSSPQ